MLTLTMQPQGKDEGRVLPSAAAADPYEIKSAKSSKICIRANLDIRESAVRILVAQINHTVCNKMRHITSTRALMLCTYPDVVGVDVRRQRVVVDFR